MALGLGPSWRAVQVGSHPTWPLLGGIVSAGARTQGLVFQGVMDWPDCKLATFSEKVARLLAGAAAPTGSTGQ